MRVLEQSIKINNERNKNQNINNDDEIDLYMQKPAFKSINASETVFSKDAINLREGINTKMSIFDSKAIF